MDPFSASQLLEQEGFVVLPGLIPAETVTRFRDSLSGQLSSDSAGIKNKKGDTYAARNVFETLPQSLTIWQQRGILDFLTQTLGQEFGLVRGLFFDKHPDRTWSLGWHKDMTIAVKDNSLPTEYFCKPTFKSGIPHVEASEGVLNNMVTLRLHLDRVTEENGPLEVIPRSHATGKRTIASSETAQKIIADPGDILAMKPLISHASGSSLEGTKMHRRILHLEFAGTSELPDRYQWYHFIRPDKAANPEL